MKTSFIIKLILLVYLFLFCLILPSKVLWNFKGFLSWSLPNIEFRKVSTFCFSSGYMANGSDIKCVNTSPWPCTIYQTFEGFSDHSKVKNKHFQKTSQHWSWWRISELDQQTCLPLEICGLGWAVEDPPPICSDDELCFDEFLNQSVFTWVSSDHTQHNYTSIIQKHERRIKKVKERERDFTHS